MNEELAALTKKVEALEASRIALTIICAALMRTHHDFVAMQLHLTALLEQQLTGGALGNLLTPAQNEYAREHVEWLQALTQIKPPARP